MTFDEHQEGVQPERFGDESDETLPCNGASAEVGNERRTEHCSNGGVHLLELYERFDTIHFGHEHVEDDQIYFRVELGVGFDGFGAGGARSYPIPVSAEDSFGQSADGPLVVNNQDMSVAVFAILCIACGSIRHGAICTDTYPKPKSGNMYEPPAITAPCH